MPTPLAAPVARSTETPGEVRHALRDVGWDGYQLLLDAFGDDGPRMYYLDGTVELMSPHFLHEGSKKVLGRMVEELIVGLRIPARGLGSTTFTKESVDKGAEPDECYYFSNLDRLRGQKKGDLDVLPPPDLVIEVEISSPLLDKLRIYAGLGVPEIWRHDGQSLTILILGEDGSYRSAPRSRAFPFLPIAGFVQQLEAYDPVDETGWAIAYRDWVRDVVAPIYQP